VATPRALVITGDLTEWGKEDEWQRFLHFYGNSPNTPSAAGLKVPVFEVVGNHDKVHGPYVTDQVAARHGGKPYAFDLDDVHFVALGEAPDDDALAWLAKDLDRFEKNVPLVVYFHLAILGPWSTGNWFGDGDYKERLGALLEGRCVAAIVHGHHHASGHYAWRGFEVYKPGAVKDNAHTFAVFHATGATLTVAYFDYDKDLWSWSEARDLCP
jgi:predicted phosphodiesterase